MDNNFLNNFDNLDSLAISDLTEKGRKSLIRTIRSMLMNCEIIDGELACPLSAKEIAKKACIEVKAVPGLILILRMQGFIKIKDNSQKHLPPLKIFTSKFFSALGLEKDFEEYKKDMEVGVLKNIKNMWKQEFITKFMAISRFLKSWL